MRKLIDFPGGPGVDSCQDALK